MKRIQIGLLGYGTVGKGFHQALKAASKSLNQHFDIELTVSKVLVNHSHKMPDLTHEGAVVTTDYKAILNDSEIAIIVEAINGAHPAAIYLTAALAKGKHVVTANKAALASAWHVLHRASAKSGAKLYYEASVAAGIPIIETLKHISLADEILAISGIVNGTTNYILSEMSQRGESYESALMRAQALGYAEADPSADVDGWDSVNKLSILCGLCFGNHISPERIARDGIRQLPYAMAGMKLIAEAKRGPAGLEVGVKLRQLTPEHPLYHVAGVENALLIQTKGLGNLKLYGQGAGAEATGTAMLKDVVELLKHMKS